MSRMMISSGKPKVPNMAILPKLRPQRGRRVGDPGLMRRGTGLIVPLFSAALATAQFTSGVSVIEVYATVTDAHGEAVAGLTAADFHVAEDGAPQTVSTFFAGEFPLSVIIALDRSFSMSGEKLTLARSAARLFIAGLKPDDEVMVLAVGSETETIVPPVPARGAGGAALDAIEPWGTTPLYDV